MFVCYLKAQCLILFHPTEGSICGIEQTLGIRAERGQEKGKKATSTTTHRFSPELPRGDEWVILQFITFSLLPSSGYRWVSITPMSSTGGPKARGSGEIPGAKGVTSRLQWAAGAYLMWTILITTPRGKYYPHLAYEGLRFRETQYSAEVYVESRCKVWSNLRAHAVWFTVRKFISEHLYIFCRCIWKNTTVR